MGLTVRARRGGWGDFSPTATCLLAGSLSAFVCQHSIMPLALPCKLAIPHKGGCGPRGGGIGAQALSVLTGKAPGGPVSPRMWMMLASRFTARAPRPVNVNISTSWL